MHQEGQVSRIPKQVRNMKMREFGEKYNGNVQAALRGFQKEKFVAIGGDGALGELDKDARKRKWVASQEVESGDGKDQDSFKVLKNGQAPMCLPHPQMLIFVSSKY
jgi:Nbl1 / Borealin N terminal